MFLLLWLLHVVHGQLQGVIVFLVSFPSSRLLFFFLAADADLPKLARFFGGMVKLLGDFRKLQKKKLPHVVTCSNNHYTHDKT